MRSVEISKELRQSISATRTALRKLRKQINNDFKFDKIRINNSRFFIYWTKKGKTFKD